jgi:spore germination protein KC
MVKFPTIIRIVTPIFLCFFLTSCVGKREITDLSIVLAVGLDKGSNEETVKVTTQLARPADARGQTGAPSGQTGEPILSLVAEGKTIFEAVRNLSSFSSRRVFWAHNFVIVINEELAKEGISDIIDFFTRNPELRMKTWIVVTPDKASEVVSTMSGLEVVPGETLQKLFRYTRLSNFAPQSEIMDILAAFLNKSSEPLLARVFLDKVKVSNEKPEKGASVKQIKLEGAGIFREDKLVGILNGKETRGLLLFREKLESGIITIPCIDTKKEDISIELEKQKFDVKPIVKNNTITFHANLETEVSVVEAGCPFSIDHDQQVKKLEKQVEKQLKTEIETTINKIQQEYKSDVLELGQVLNNKYPAKWKQVEDKWMDVFPTVEITVQVNSKIIDGTLLFKPTK